MKKVILLLLPLAVFVYFSHSSKPAQAEIVVNSDGSLTYSSPGQVLGDKSGDDSGSGDSHSAGSSGGDFGSSSSSGNSSAVPVPASTNNSGQEKVEVKKEGKDKVEVRERIKIGKKTEKGLETSEAVEVEKSKTRSVVRLEVEKEADGTFKFKLKNEAGEEVEQASGSGEKSVRIEERSDDKAVKIKLRETGEVEISRKQFSAQTRLPLSLDLKTNRLLVKTPDGLEVASIDPDEAVGRVLAAGDLDEIGDTPIAEALKEASPTAQLARAVELKINPTGRAVFAVKGNKNHNLFGFLPLKTERTIEVDAQTGAIKKVEETLLSRLISLLSL